MRILVVEDEKLLCDGIAEDLELEKYTVEQCYDGAKAYDLLLNEAFDLLILDLNLPGMDGLELLRHIRTEQPELRVLILSARSQLSDKVAGLDLGADDYLTKPFAIEELFARIRVALKRSEAVRAASGVGGVEAGMAGGADVGAVAMPPVSGSTQASASPSPATLAVGSVALDPGRREVTVGGSPIALTAREFDVLALLMEHAETVLTRERVAREALGYEYVGDTNNVDVHIAHLRAKIEDAGSARIIQTVRGVGYVCRA